MGLAKFMQHAKRRVQDRRRSIDPGVDGRTDCDKGDGDRGVDPHGNAACNDFFTIPKADISDGRFCEHKVIDQIHVSVYLHLTGWRIVCFFFCRVAFLVFLVPTPQHRERG